MSSAATSSAARSSFESPTEVRAAGPSRPRGHRAAVRPIGGWWPIAGFALAALAATTLIGLPALTGAVAREFAPLLTLAGMTVPVLVALLVERIAPSGLARRPLWGLGGPALRVLGACALALVIVGLVGALQYGLTLALGLAKPAHGIDPLPLAAALAVQFAVMLAGSIGEEFAWRGWLHSRLGPLGLPATIGVTWVIWTAWHAVVLLPGAGEAGWGTVLIATAGNLAALAVLLAVLRERVDSAWPCVVTHAGANSLLLVVTGALLATVSPTEPAFLGIAAIAWVGMLVAAGLVHLSGRRRRA